MINEISLARAVDLLKASNHDQREASKGPWPGYTVNIAAQQENMGEGAWARVLLGTPTGLAAGYVSSSVGVSVLGNR